MRGVGGRREGGYASVCVFVVDVTPWGDVYVYVSVVVVVVWCEGKIAPIKLDWLIGTISVKA